LTGVYQLVAVTGIFLASGIALLKSLCYEYEGFQKPPKLKVEKEES